MLNTIGIKNVVNTSCPTTWSLNEEHCKRIPTRKASKVVFTVTGHKPSDSDRLMLSTLGATYDELHFYPQQLGDMEYFMSVADEKTLEKVNIIPPSLNAYDLFLSENDTDYVGTRLHGGIRALQHGIRSIIIGIDDRSLEIQKDINLSVLARKDMQELGAMLSSEFSTELTLPLLDIQRFKNQFQQIYELKGN